MLGRTFFQEAYGIADYGSANFSVSQCKWDTPLSENIVAILPPSNGTSSELLDSKTLSTGAIAGIAVGGALILVGALLLYFCYIKPRRKRHVAELGGNPIENGKKKQQHQQTEPFTKPELDNTAVANTPLQGAHNKIDPVEMGNTGLYELPAREPTALEVTEVNKRFSWETERLR